MAGWKKLNPETGEYDEIPGASVPGTGTPDEESSGATIPSLNGKTVIEMGDRLLGRDGCLNFFAGPAHAPFMAEFNFYNVHYASTHVVGTSGGNTDDMIESLAMMSDGRLNTASMITHIGGLNAVVDTVMNLPKIPGGKKLIYTNIDLPLTAIADFEKAGETDPLFAELDKICKKHNMLWNTEAEKYLLANAKAI
jgi:hypothetical protein